MSTQPIPRQTEKTKKAQEKVKAAIKKRADDAAKKISDNAAREERVRVSTEDMQAELNRRIKQGDAMRIKPKDPKEMAAEGQRQMRAQLKRLKTSVANAVSKRRFLFDQYKVDARKRDARKAALEKIGKAVFDVPMDGGSSSHNSSWKASAKKDEHRLLNNDEKEEMELYDDDEFEGDPLLIGADGQPLSDDQLKLLYTISRYSHKVAAHPTRMREQKKAGCDSTAKKF